MSTLTEWFEGRTVDEEAGQTILPMPFWVALIAAALALLPGCATTEPSAQVCFMRMMGVTEHGYSVVQQLCMTPEAFAESQK